MIHSRRPEEINALHLSAYRGALGISGSKEMKVGGEQLVSL
jgi:hypothetical protein